MPSIPPRDEHPKFGIGGVAPTDALLPVTHPAGEHAGDALLRDLDLGERLGFDRPRDIRKLVERNRGELERFGILRHVAQTHGGGRGRPTTEYLFNEEQALYVTSKCTTPTAADVTVAIVRTFVAWRHGRLAPAAPQFTIPTTLSGALQLAADQARQLERQSTQIACLAPKALALDRIASTSGSLNITEAAKLLGMKRPELVRDLQTRRIIYRRQGQQSWLGFSDKEAAGLVEHKHSTIERPDGSQKAVAQVRLTTKLLTRLAEQRSGGQPDLLQ